MSDIDITQDANLTTNTSPTLADRLLLVRNSDSVLTDITPDQLMKIIALLTAKTNPTGSDSIVIYDAAASLVKQVTLANLSQSARATKGSNQSINDSTWTSITFDTESFDTNTIHDTSSNTSRLTCKVAGKYIVTGCAGFDTNTTGMRAVRLLVNGGTSYNQQRQAPIASFETYASVSDIIDMAVNDYVELQGFQSSGGALNVMGAGASLAMKGF